jgi:hypothetical protein
MFLEEFDSISMVREDTNHGEENGISEFGFLKNIVDVFRGI